MEEFIFNAVNNKGIFLFVFYFHTFNEPNNIQTLQYHYYNYITLYHYNNNYYHLHYFYYKSFLFPLAKTL